MQEQTAEVVRKQKLRTALIIDDAYDAPTAGSVVSERQAFINQLRSDADFAAVGAVLGIEPLGEDRLIELLDSDETVQALHQARGQMPGGSANALFGAWEAKQDVKRIELEPIEQLLEAVGFDVSTCGATRVPDSANPDLVIMDLFLNDAEQDGANSADLAAAILDPLLPKDDTPPLVVLVSTRKPDLQAVNERFRLKANVPGCRFAFVAKNDFRDDQDEAVYRLFRLFDHAENSAVFDRFSRQIETSAARANREFVSLLRRFELSDYADLVDLVVDAEGIPLRQYLLDLFALSWASVVESSTDVAAALSELDALGLNVDRYPPNELAPNDAVLEMYEKALFRHGDGLQALDCFAKLALGDVLQSRETETGFPDLYLTIVQDCDQTRGDPPDAAFLIKGHVAELPRFRDLKVKAYPFTHKGQRLVVSWDVEAWQTLRPAEFDGFMTEHGLERCLQLRPPWSLSLQSAFFQHLSRPAEMAMPHAVHGVDLQVLVRDQNGRGRSLINFDGRTNGFLLAGRRKNAVTRLVMSSAFAVQLRSEIRQVKEQDGTLEPETKDWLEDLLKTPAKLQALRAQLELHKDGKQKAQPQVLAGAGVASKPEAHWTVGQGLGTAQNVGPNRLVINVRVVDQYPPESEKSSG
ncbi:MAG: hypothetical protein AAGL69_16145 [Pseudomonadota bacterium]